MAWTTPKTWSGSEVLTASDINAQVSANCDYLYDNKPQAVDYVRQGTSTAQLNQRIESGSANTLWTTINYGSRAVTFSTAFGTLPRVMVTPVGAENVTAAAAFVGSAGFTAYVGITSGTYSGTVPFMWIAIGA